jgi:hypothetical protein
MITALLLAASVSLAPTPAELEALLAPLKGAKVQVRRVQCEVLGDPTEHRCAWRQRTAGGRWEAWSAILAQDGGRWILIDAPGRTSRP